ncbi:MAG: type II 3-dehydroquinate dehydratase [Bacteroidota bacterium]
MKIAIINGPNLNLLGNRENHIYGSNFFEDFLILLKSKFPNITIDYYQSNIEGEIINYIQQTANVSDGIILNPGGYSHTSVAIADAIRATETPIVEVHISNIASREIYRQVSLTAQACKGVISGFGLDSYVLAIESFLL